MNLESLLSDLRLGVRAVVGLPLRRLVEREDGQQRFEHNFFPERLFPTSLVDRERLREASRCVACGVCDAALAGEAKGVRLRPSLLPSVFARSVVELPFAAGEVGELVKQPELLRAAERLCPTGVPLERLAGWLQERGGAGS